MRLSAQINRGQNGSETHRRNILLMKRSLLIGFLFLPLGTSVHICIRIAHQSDSRPANRAAWTTHFFHIFEHL